MNVLTRAIASTLCMALLVSTQHVVVNMTVNVKPERTLCTLYLVVVMVYLEFANDRCTEATPLSFPFSLSKTTRAILTIENDGKGTRFDEYLQKDHILIGM